MAVRDTIRAKWFWYCIFTLGCWGPWVFCSKLGSRDIPANGMEFLFAIGGVPIALVMLAGRHFSVEKDIKGITYGLIVGILSAIGQLALFAAFRSGGNAAVIATATGLYPMVTVILAVIFLRERLTRTQIIGLGFAAVAFVIFSLS